MTGRRRSFIELNQERLDRARAAIGDLDAIKRNLQREEIELQRERIAQARRALEPAALEQAPPPAKSESPRNRGGCPPKWKWTEFYREIVRLANSPDGLPDRPKLMKHMLDWTTREWGDSPAESLVREHISKVYPD